MGSRTVTIRLLTDLAVDEKYNLVEGRILTATRLAFGAARWVVVVNGEEIAVMESEAEEIGS
jgi:hypothetical protein